MAKLPDGLFGGFRGRIGNVVGVLRKGRYYVRVAPGKIKNPRTPKQQFNRKRFALASRLAARLQPFIEQGFGTVEGKTPRGACISYNMRSDILSGKDSGIRYPNIMVSTGALQQVEKPLAKRTEEGSIQVRWQNNSGMGNALGDDRIMLLALGEDKQFPACYKLKGTARSDGYGLFDLDETLENAPGVHVYLSVTSPGRRLTANSAYLGFI